MMTNEQFLKIRVIRNATNSYLFLKGYDSILDRIAKIADSVLREEKKYRTGESSSSCKKKMST